MVASLLSLLLASCALFSFANALTAYPESQFFSWSPQQLAVQAGPMFFFGQAEGYKPCYPTYAMTGSDSAGYQQVAAGALCNWPNPGCNCVNPDKPIKNPGQAFPVYINVKMCSNIEVRVAYNLFYSKDGWNPLNTGGHYYPWERVIIRWIKFADGTWRPDEILLSSHSSYKRIWWKDIQNTFAHSEFSAAQGGSNGRKNLDHPKVYVAWSKHAHFDSRNTGWIDAASQLDDRAFRSDDWWHAPNNFIVVEDKNTVGLWLDYFNWGKATSDPASVYKGLCSA
ncbi:hypothetical protein V8C35DRAFT_326751 [Trichoderma chlorosporum]